MKNYKKLLAGLCMLLAVAAAFFTLDGKALAGVAPGDISGGTYAFQDGANIIGDFGPSGKVTFTDANQTDPTPNYVPDSAAFCDPGDMPDQNGINGKIKFGINLQSSDKLAPSIPAQIKLGYYTGANVCNGVLLSKNISNPGQLAQTDFQWDGDTITSLSGADSQDVFTPAPNQNNEVLYLFNASDGCADGAILLDHEKGNTGRYYKLASIEGSFPRLSENLDSYPAIKGYFDKSKCHVISVNTINIAGTAGTPSPNSTNPSGSGGNNGGTCELNSHGFSFAWAMCPLLAAASNMADFLTGLFEGQLSFTISQSISNKADQDNVKATWSLVKNIASALMVIIMLVMIISQAIGSGVFDAYTIRKLLPRLILAVILMQISWPFFSWVVNVFDDIGKGLAGLLAEPFGGIENLRLGGLLQHAHIGSSTSSTGLIVINWVGLIVALGIGMAALPAVMGFALAALISILVGVATLLFRKILIILLLIFSPVALLAWVLPGTQRYWKFWQDNFLKTMMMFPIALALIYVGRIFAYVTGSQSNGTFFNFILIMVGYFGPLFLLPKTYRWGGGIMSTAGQYVNSIGERTNKALEPGFKGIGERWQGKRADKLEYNRRGARAALTRGFRRVQSGHMLPTKRSRALALQTGSKWAGEERELATIYATNVYNKALSEGYVDQGGRRYEAGVQAAKVATAELTRHSDHRIGEEAVKRFVATASWPEAQSIVDPEGRHIFDNNPNWNNAAAKDPDTYKAVLAKRTDAVAHIVQSADRHYEGTAFSSRGEEADTKSGYRINYAIDQQLSNEDFSNESDGFWEEAAQRATITADMTDEQRANAEAIQTNLRNRFQTIADLGGTAPQQLLGHLANGGALQDNVTAALGGIDVRTYIQRTPPTDRRVDVGTEEEVDLHPEDRRRIIRPGDPDYRPPSPTDIPR